MTKDISRENEEYQNIENNKEKLKKNKKEANTTDV